MKNVSRFRNYLRNFVQFCFVGYNVKIPSVEQGPGSTHILLKNGPWILHCTKPRGPWILHCTTCQRALDSSLYNYLEDPGFSIVQTLEDPRFSIMQTVEDPGSGGDKGGYLGNLPPPRILGVNTPPRILGVNTPLESQG